MKYSLNIQETKNYYEDQYYCECSYCQNYRKVLPFHHPEIVQILSEFGLSINLDFEIIHYGVDSEISQDHLYEGLYAVFGTLCEDNLVVYDNDGVKITLLKKESAGGLLPKTDNEFFMLDLWVRLPYKLNE